MNNTDPNIDFQSFDFSLAAGAVEDIYAPYSYFRIMSLTGANELTVKFQSGTAQKFPASVGIGFRDNAGESIELQKITLINESGSAVSGSISVAAGGDIHDSRVTFVGNVSVNPASDTFVTGYLDIDTEAEADCNIPVRSNGRVLEVRNIGNLSVFARATQGGGAGAGDYTDGWEIKPGEIWNAPNGAQVFFYKQTGTSAGDQLITYCEHNAS
jgi:hypothetical protein